MRYAPDIEWIEDDDPPFQLSFISWASNVPDPRIDRHKLYPLTEILFIALCTFLSGGDTFYDMERFGNRKLSWLKRFLPYKNGIPSHDTFARVLAMLDSNQPEQIVSHGGAGYV
ncbi:MAG: transposase family protein, partial [Myxococcota bacterium]